MWHQQAQFPAQIAETTKPEIVPNYAQLRVTRNWIHLCSESPCHSFRSFKETPTWRKRARTRGDMCVRAWDTRLYVNMRNVVFPRQDTTKTDTIDFWLLSFRPKINLINILRVYFTIVINSFAFEVLIVQKL